MIVLLVAIALLLAVVAAARYHHEDVSSDVNVEEISHFEAETDSLTVDVSKPTRHTRDHETTKKRPKRRDAKPKPAREPRPVDPVPKF